MEKIFNGISVVFGIIGGCLANWLGGWDNWLIVLVAFMILDYVTGLIKAIINKQLSSAVGLKGIFKKICVLIAVGVAVLLQSLIDLPLREIVITFFVCNEGISLLENLAEFIPIPAKLKEVLLQLRDKADVQA